MRVAVLGLGLVGGSVAQALASQTAAHQLLGWDPDDEVRAAAARWGLPVVDALADAVAPADLVVLAGPVGANDDLLAAVLQQRPDVLVTDVGSVKVPLVQRWQALGSRGRVVPGHPMAGSEASGWDAADPGLLVGARWVLCPGPWCTAADWLAVAELVLSTGAVVVPAHPVRHDEAVALASHVPHVLAAVVSATSAQSPLAKALAAGSFRDLTRVSAAPPARTGEFLFANRLPLAESLHRVADELRAVAEELEELDRSALSALLSEGHAGRLAWEASRTPAHTQPVPVGDEEWAEELQALADAGGVVTAVTGHLLTVAVPERRDVSALHLLAPAASLHDALAQRGIDAGPDPVDLSLGTPVDPTPQVARDALAAASDAPGYPLVWGTPPVREAVTAWFARRGAPGLDPDGVLPTIGSKEAIAWLPTLLGLGAGDLVAHPELAYPTYAAGAHLAGATPVATADPTALSGVALCWVNSPGNPHGAVATVEELRAVVAWARAAGTVLVSDECYLTLGWDAEPVSLLDPRVCDGDVTGLLVCYSLSKQSNLAGYRAGFLAGDPALVARLVEVRKHAGMIVPRPVQAVLAAVLADDGHVAEQKERYRARRTTLRTAVEAAGLRVEHSVGGLYLWCTRDEADWDTVAALARVGILAAPGSFYGPAGGRHVRLALTATDARIALAAERLAGLA